MKSLKFISYRKHSIPNPIQTHQSGRTGKGCHKLVVSEHPRSGSDPPIMSDLRRGVSQGPSVHIHNIQLYHNSPYEFITTLLYRTYIKTRLF